MPKRDELTALDPTKTISSPTFRRVSNPNGPTRREVWEATSADGVWTYVREESPGTPWLVRHNATDRIAYLAGSLRKARVATAAGWALNSLNRQMAEETLPVEAPTHGSWTGVTSHPGADPATCELCIDGLAYEAMVAEAS